MVLRLPHLFQHGTQGGYDAGTVIILPAIMSTIPTATGMAAAITAGKAFLLPSLGTPALTAAL